MKTALVIMAAGIGSRFGGGIKQLSAMGPSGEIIIDYSIHDAVEAGFDKVVFIIRHDLEADFREIIGNRAEKIVEVAYAFQDIRDLPEGYTCPADRKKPWGTGQAILAAEKVVEEPFVVINADDYYGKEGFKALHDYLVSSKPGQDGFENMAMAGFILGNTLSENGSVKRGVCSQDENGFLKTIVETEDIVKTEKGAGIETADGIKEIDANGLVSMNMWAFYPTIFRVLKKGFPEFLDGVGEGDIKAEYLLPDVVDGLIKSGRGAVKVLPSHDKWFGVTYKEDSPTVKAAFAKLVEEGVYKSPLF